MPNMCIVTASMQVADIQWSPGMYKTKYIKKWMVLNTIYILDLPPTQDASQSLPGFSCFSYGDPNVPSCATVAGWGIDPKYIMYLSTDAGLNCHQQYGFHIPSPRFESSLYISKETIRGCMQTKKSSLPISFCHFNGKRLGPTRS